MKYIKLFLFVPLLVVIYACPYESKVPLEAHPVECIDTSLLGYWYGIIKDGSDYFGIEALDIKKSSDSVYAITRYGKAIKGDIILPDTAYFTGYTSYIGKQQFMNIEGTVLITMFTGKKTIVKTEKVFYLSAINRKHDTLTVKTIAEKFSPSRKLFNSPGQLTAEVQQLLNKKSNIYDDMYSLSYRKMPDSFRPGTK